MLCIGFLLKSWAFNSIVISTISNIYSIISFQGSTGPAGPPGPPGPSAVPGVPITATGEIINSASAEKVK